jgi:hypothetical protein
MAPKELNRPKTLYKIVEGMQISLPSTPKFRKFVSIPVPGTTRMVSMNDRGEF